MESVLQGGVQQRQPIEVTHRVAVPFGVLLEGWQRA